MTQAIPDEYNDFITACVDMIGRTGASNWELRYDEGDRDDQLTVWMCLATYDGVSVRSMGGMVREVPTRHEVAAAFRPDQAAFRLVELLCDGGDCQTCHRPVAMHLSEHDGMEFGMMSEFCHYVYDADRKRFKRGCE